MGLGPGVGLASYFNVDNAPGNFGGGLLAPLVHRSGHRSYFERAQKCEYVLPELKNYLRSYSGRLI